MRWDNLFDDLESQLHDELTSDDADLRIEEERLRLARLTLRDRLVALRSAGLSVRLVLPTGRMLHLEPVTVGRDWVAGPFTVESSGLRRHGVVPLDSLGSLVIDPDDAARSIRDPEEEPSLSRRLGIAHVLRDLCRRRSPVEVAMVSGGSIHGTIDRVARDHIDLAVHEPGVPRRRRDVVQVRLVPFSAIELVASG